MKHANLRHYLNSCARMVRSMVRRQSVLFGGRKMRTELKPAFYVVLYWAIVIIAFYAFFANRAQSQTTASGTLSVPDGSLSWTLNPTTHLWTFTYSLGRVDNPGSDPADYYTSYSVRRVDPTTHVSIGDASITRNSVESGWGASPWHVTGTASFTMNPTYVYKIRIVQVKDDNVTFMGDQSFFTDSLAKKVLIKIPINKTDFPITYKLMQDGVQVGSVTLQPGEGLLQEMTVPSTSTVTVVSSTTGIGFDGNTWVVEESMVTEQEVGQITPTEGGTPPESNIASPTLPESQNPAVNPINDPANPDTVNTNKNKPIWKPAEEQVAGEQTNLLTIEAYREGVEKLVDAKTPTGLGEEEAVVEGENVELRTVNTEEILPSTAPNFFPETPGTSSTISATLPSITAGGKTWPAHSFSINLADYSTAITWFRSICSLALWIGFFILCVNTARGAGADK